MEGSARGPVFHGVLRQAESLDGVTMIRAKRILLTLPFAVATVLTILVAFADRLHLQRIDGYAFLFAAPWVWLLRYFPQTFHPRWLQTMMDYVEILWIPALLYSASLWVGLRIFRLLRQRTSTQFVINPHITN